MVKFFGDLIVAAVVGWIGGAVIGFAVNILSGASDTVLAAGIASISSITLLFVGRYFEQKRELRQRINSEKIDVYKQFYKFYFEVFTYEKIHGYPKPENELLTEMLDFQKDVLFWGSDEIIKAYAEFRVVLTSKGVDPSKDDKIHEHLGNVFRAAAKLIISMRKDIGYGNTKFSSLDLVDLQMNRDQDTARIREALKVRP